ncbi:ABC transporter substrate-binding protein [Candidatus Njordibacter sp. Uisw_056]|jgi:branched-chain amino acid transport system substrate-binding protein|uniref:ABC transporter substrate-binding protein n=1 Tax=Candidatus Njordibacter sp. Uisw_056 TaxID=3230973 RepID=UPI003D4861D3
MQNTFKKTLLAAAAATLIAGTAYAGGHEEKVGVILGFTGPIESLTPTMADSAELAFAEASNSGLLLDGKVIVAVRADSTCVDSSAATAAAERLVNSDNVVAIMGADCSGVTGAIAKNVGAPNGVAMISPSATSPGLSSIDDNGVFFRTAPSDARQGVVLADIVMGRGIDTVAVTYTNNDYGKGLADAFATAYRAAGGTITIEAAHEDGKADYSAEVGALSASGASELVVLGYLDQGGRGIIQSSLDTGAFDRFILADGMIGDSLLDVDGGIEGTFGTLPGSESAGAAMFNDVAAAAGLDGSAPYAAQSYDAGALIALAMQSAGSSDRAGIVAHINKVANAPGEIILPGELAKGLQILADGGQINYEGATNVEFDANGDPAGSYKEQEVKGGSFTTIKVH